MWRYVNARPNGSSGRMMNVMNVQMKAAGADMYVSL